MAVKGIASKSAAIVLAMCLSFTLLLSGCGAHKSTLDYEPNYDSANEAAKKKAVEQEQEEREEQKRIENIAYTDFTVDANQASPFNLDKNVSMITDWGGKVAFRVNNACEEKNMMNNDSFFFTWYSGFKDGGYISISLSSPHSLSSSFDSWLESEEESDTKSAYEQYKEEQAIANEHNFEPRYGDDPNLYPDLTDFSAIELGTRDYDGLEMRFYRISYTTTFSDYGYEKLLEKAPDSEQSWVTTTYYAVVKSSHHDLEVGSNNENLLYDFINTLQIQWKQEK